MHNPLVLAIDQGTNSTRGMLFDFKGSVVFQSSKNVSLNRIDDTNVEQDPIEILDSVKYVISRCFENVPPGMQVERIGIATQRSSLLAMNKHGAPISPLLSWQDRRTSHSISCYGNSEQFIKKTTGLPLSPHYGATKFRWLIENNDFVKKAAAQNDLYLSPLVSFLLYNLLDEPVFVCDHANAHRTLLMNLQKGDWDDSLLNLFQINRELLPLCSPVSTTYGTMNGIPVTAVSGDQNAAIFSQGNHPVKSVLINVGTGAFILKSTGCRVKIHNHLLTGIMDSDSTGIQYTLEGTVNGAASAILWAKERLGIEGDVDLNEFLKESQNPEMFINTVGGLGSPFWKSGPEPYWVNNPQSVSDAISGVIESIVFLIKINLDEMDPEKEAREVFLSGGVSTLTWFCQRLSNCTGLKVSRLNMSEATARGIAFLAAGKPPGWVKNSVESFYPAPIDTKELLRFTVFKEYMENL